MMKHWIAAVTAGLAWILSTGLASAQGAELPDVRIDYERHLLPNGLTLLIHEDRKTPIVAVNVWYHVGSKDERPGRTGFAHLFEHLMFNGSENFNDEFFRPLEAAGATKLNGTTWYDRTNYFQNVPTNALDLTLWLESDRMGHLLGAIDQARLDEQRGVVLNEKRQSENRPYGKVWEAIAQATYPAGHPYSWTTIGSAEDLNAATLDDVKTWFREHYGAANAVLVIAGDVDAADVKKKVEHYFGDIPAGPVRRRHDAWVPRMEGEKRMVLQDRVPQTRIFKVWNVPGFCDPQANILGIAAGVLGDGKNSRLYERLVYRDQLATNVGVGLGPFEIASQFLIDVTVRPGGDAGAVEAAIDEELTRFLREGPTAAELERVRTKTFAQAIRGLERVDGFGGKSATLAQYEVYCGTPERYTEELREIREATPLAVRDLARHWLADGVFVLTVEPFPEYQTADSGADRSKLPEPGTPPDLALPPLQRAKLSNGLEVVLAERHEAPVVQLSLIADAGFAADAGIKAGTARLTLDMLDEGAGDDDALALAARAERLGAQLSAGSTLDTSFVNLNALKVRLEPSLDLFADVLLRPRFAEDELERLRQLLLAGIQQEKAEPYGIASRLYPGLIYGEGHAYANPRSGTGTEDSVRAITLADIKAFYERWLRPDSARLLVVGDTTLDELVPLLEARLGSWAAPEQAPPTKQLDEVALPSAPRIFLVNRTGAEQSLILGTHLAPPRADPDDLAMQLANAVLGGNFVSRMNMNLREEKGWSYGAFTSISGAKAQRPFIAYAPVQSDKTVDALREMRRELEAARGSAPLKAAEIDFARDSLVRSLPGDNETVGEISGSYTSILVHGLADDYWNDYVERIGELSTDAVNAAGRRLLQPQALTWVIVGDLSRIEEPVRALKWGMVTVLDTDGKPVARPAQAGAIRGPDVQNKP